MENLVLLKKIFKKNFSVSLFFCLFFFFNACTNFSGKSAEDHFFSKKENPKRESISEFHYKINSVLIKEDSTLFNLYAKAIPNEERFKNYRVRIFIDGNITQKKESLWYLGMALGIPFWPFMPNEAKLLYTFQAEIYQNKTLVHKILFQEEETVQAFIYGALRKDLITEASDFIHLKFAYRFYDFFKMQTEDNQSFKQDF